MSDASPPPKPTKSILTSKVLWAQILMLLAGFYPPVAAWIAANPVDLLAVVAAVNVLLRFATSGKVSLFPGLSEAVTTAPGTGENNTGAGGLPLLVGMFAAAALMGALPSCSSYPLTGSVTYRDPQTGAKAGLEFTPGQAPAAILKVQLYDPRTGQPLGVVDLRGGK